MVRARIGVALLVACQSSPSLDDRAELAARVEVDCGAVAHGPNDTCDPDATSKLQCFQIAVAAGRRATITLGQRYDDSSRETALFAVPGASATEVVVFVDLHDGWAAAGTVLASQGRCAAAALAATAAGCPDLRLDGCGPMIATDYAR